MRVSLHNASYRISVRLHWVASGPDLAQSKTNSPFVLGEVHINTVRLSEAA
jgi:hypothetical protein